MLQMARRMQYSVIGLPHYTIWHLYEPSADDLRHMAEMDKEKKKLADEADAAKAREESPFEVTTGKSQWDKDKEALRQNALAREEAKAPAVVTKPDVKSDPVAEKQEIRPVEGPAEKNVKGKSGAENDKSKASQKIAPAAFVAANAPLGNWVAKTQEKLQNKQQQQLQKQQVDSSNANDQDKASLQPAPDHAAAVAAANVARQGSDSREVTNGL